MIRHIVMLKFKEDADPKDVAEFKRGVWEVGDRIPGIRAYVCGSNLGTSVEGLAAESGFSDNFDFCVMADLDDYDAYKVYADHEEHQLFIEKTVRKVLAQRVAVQFDTTEYQ